MLVYTIIGLMLVVVAINAVRAVFIGSRISGEAREDYAYRCDEGIIDPSISEAEFVKAYKRCHGPRGPVYAALTFLAAAVLTPALLAAISVSYEYLWRWSGQERAFEPGYLVWQFILFGSVIAGWALIVHIGARLYYKNLPGSLEAEIAAQKQAG